MIKIEVRRERRWYWRRRNKEGVIKMGIGIICDKDRNKEKNS